MGHSQGGSLTLASALQLEDLIDADVCFGAFLPCPESYKVSSAYTFSK